MSRFKPPRRNPDDVPVNGRTLGEAMAIERERRRVEQAVWREKTFGVRPRRAAAPPAPVPPKPEWATAEEAAAYWTAVSARLDEIAAANEKRRAS